MRCLQNLIVLKLRRIIFCGQMSSWDSENYLLLFLFFRAATVENIMEFTRVIHGACLRLFISNKNKNIIYNVYTLSKKATMDAIQ